MKKLFLLFSIALACAVVFFTAPGCANIVPPAGGPKDSLPPRLLRATPTDSTRNFSGRSIQLVFDEYVDLNTGAGGRLIMSPIYETRPEVEASLRTITIRLKDSLEPNTTYTFEFDGVIKDINEGNPLPNLTYTFSTGPRIDTFTLRGKVLMANTGRPDSTLTMFLHRNLADSAVVNATPRYMARVSGDGSFSFRNLPAGTFALYAIGDASSTRRYLGKQQAFAFLDSTIRTGPGAPEVELLAYVESPRAETGSARTQRGAPQQATDRRLRYSSDVGGRQSLFDSSLVLRFENRVTRLDSSRVRLTRDTSFTPVQASLQLDSSDRRLTIRHSWTPGAPYQLILEKDFVQDSSGRSQLRNDTLRFTARALADYGKLSLRFRNVSAAQRPVLQFVQNDKVVLSVSIAGGTFYRELFEPGDYELRILYDRNGNGQWDPGSFFGTRRQPERVLPLERKLTVKPDMDNEVEIAL